MFVRKIYRQHKSEKCFSVVKKVALINEENAVISSYPGKFLVDSARRKRYFCINALFLNGHLFADLTKTLVS